MNSVNPLVKSSFHFSLNVNWPYTLPAPNSGPVDAPPDLEGAEIKEDAGVKTGAGSDVITAVGASVKTVVGTGVKA